MSATSWSAPVRSGRVASSTRSRSAPPMSPATTTCMTRRRALLAMSCSAPTERHPILGYRACVCGIAGLVSWDTAPDEQAVRRMNTALKHRGPDAEGVWTQGPAVLGFRRLAIIDLSPEANQPLLNEDGTIGVVVNGEIYNFEALRAELLRRGHRFRSHSDCEVVVHLYEVHGAE